MKFVWTLNFHVPCIGFRFRRYFDPPETFAVRDGIRNPFCDGFSNITWKLATLNLNWHIKFAAYGVPMTGNRPKKADVQVGEKHGMMTATLKSKFYAAFRSGARTKTRSR